MSYYINKFVAGVTSPIGVSLILLAFCGLAALRKRRCAAWAAGILAFCLLGFLSTNIAVRLIAQPLDDCETVEVADLPHCDAVLVLGGGMALHTPTGRPEMYAAADRVWQGARVFKAGKAPKIIVTGGGTISSTVPLLVDFGIPSSSILTFDDPRNTEEEAKRIKAELGEKAKIVLVTSAWHMRRALLLFRRAGLDVVPCAADYEMSVKKGLPLEAKDFAPNADSLMRNSFAIKEYVANFAYRLLKR